MSRQSDINEKMRAILIDWLIEVSHTAIDHCLSLFDRFKLYNLITNCSCRCIWSSNWCQRHSSWPLIWSIGSWLAKLLRERTFSLLVLPRWCWHPSMKRFGLQRWRILYISLIKLTPRIKFLTWYLDWNYKIRYTLCIYLLFWVLIMESIMQEKQMLNELKFNLTVPTPYVFLVRFLKAAGSDTQVKA